VIGLKRHQKEEWRGLLTLITNHQSPITDFLKYMVMRFFKNNRGVALMLVLSAVSVLTAMGVEFAYNTSIYYDLAQNEANRLQAYYMAKSAYEFMRLELKFDRVFRQVVQQQNLGQYLGANAQLPLCQQFPLSTGLIRTVFMGGGLAGLAGGEGGEAVPEGGEAPPAAEGPAAEEAKQAAEGIEKMRQGASLTQEKGAQDFLQFEGDFDGECIDEGTKINLNGFAGLSQTATVEGQPSPFDQYKQFLFRFLSEPRFKPLFDAAKVRIPDVVNSIGDWIDANSDINDFDGRTGGAEMAPYQRAEVPIVVRNGKLLTLMEAYLIDGVTDGWFEPMIDSFTIYGDGTVNACTANQDIVEALIRRYVEATPNLPPLRLEDPEEMGRLVAAIEDACVSGSQGEQLKQAIATALNQAIGAVTGGETGTPATPPAAAQPGQAGAAAAAPAGVAGGFAAYLRTESRFFSLKLSGQSGDITVRIKAVLDVKETDPNRWKLLYWKVY
jgi:type II secretory pathway component PulK